jgi:hypothetical protein
MDLAIRAIVLYAFVFFLTRVVGRRELSSLQPFDLILLIVLGDSIQQGLTQDDYSVTGAIIVVGTIAALQVATSYASFRIPRLRPALDGLPIVVVEGGKRSRRTCTASGSPSMTWPRGCGSSRSPRSTRFSGPCSRRAARSASSRSPPKLPACLCI